MAVIPAKDKDALALRLKRVEGQLRGIQKMVQQDEECEKVAQQLCAARKALDRAFYQMMACMIEQQFLAGGKSSPEMRQRLSHVTGILTKFA